MPRSWDNVPFFLWLYDPDFQVIGTQLECGSLYPTWLLQFLFSLLELHQVSLEQFCCGKCSLHQGCLWTSAMNSCFERISVYPQTRWNKERFMIDCKKTTLSATDGGMRRARTLVFQSVVLNWLDKVLAIALIPEKLLQNGKFGFHISIMKTEPPCSSDVKRGP